MKSKTAGISYSEMHPAKLELYLADVQLPYLRKALSTFMLCSRLIAGNQTQPGDKILADLLHKLGQLIGEHLNKDEQELFPLLRTGLTRGQNGEWIGLRDAFKASHLQHMRIRRLFRKTRLLSRDYAPPADASPSLKLCYAQVFDFEQDILKHIFLVEEVLFPRLTGK